MDDGLVPTQAGMPPTWLQNVEAKPKSQFFQVIKDSHAALWWVVGSCCPSLSVVVCYV
jgi:hypothetical protein